MAEEKTLSQLVNEALDNCAEGGRRDWIFNSTDEEIAVDLLDCDSDIEKWASDMNHGMQKSVAFVAARVTMWKERNRAAE